MLYYLLHTTFHYRIVWSGIGKEWMCMYGPGWGTECHKVAGLALTSPESATRG